MNGGVGKEYPSAGYNQGPRALHTLFTSAVQLSEVGN